MPELMIIEVARRAGRGRVELASGALAHTTRLSCDGVAVALAAPL